jgi:hypothetical protein
MYNALVIGVFLIVLGLMLVHWHPKMLPGVETFADATGATSGKKTAEKELKEGFAAVAVDPARVPACVARSAPAQALLARFASIPTSDDAAEELRLLVSKLCCIEADIKTPAAGVYRTATLQFRTSHDMEPASTLVGRCLAGAVQPRDVVLIMDKFNKRGGELIKSVLGGCPEAAAEFAAVSNTTRAALASCCRPAPTMDHPLGARDLGFWEPERVADLSQYQGISAAPK